MKTSARSLRFLFFICLIQPVFLISQANAQWFQRPARDDSKPSVASDSTSAPKEAKKNERPRRKFLPRIFGRFGSDQGSAKTGSGSDRTASARIDQRTADSAQKKQESLSNREPEGLNRSGSRPLVPARADPLNPGANPSQSVAPTNGSVFDPNQETSFDPNVELNSTAPSAANQPGEGTSNVRNVSQNPLRKPRADHYEIEAQGMPKPNTLSNKDVNPLIEGSLGPEGVFMQLPMALTDIGGGTAPSAIANKVRSAEQTGFLARGLGIQKAPIKAYGWIENSVNVNANGRPTNDSNFSVYPDRLANQWMGNQYYLVLENPIEQQDTVNFGFRVDTLFGNDWHFTKSFGMFDGSFPNNAFAGIDFPQIYGEMHLPILTKGGIDFKGGRWYSIGGYEGAPAIARPLLSIPYSFNYTPFTFFGLLSTFHLTDRINIFNGTVNGWDRWLNESYKWGYIGGFTWISRTGRNTLGFTFVNGSDQLPYFLPANTPYSPTSTPPIGFLGGRINPFYGASKRSYFSSVWTHKWSEKLLQVAETDQVYDPAEPGYSKNGAVSSIAYYGLVNWFLYSFTPKVTGVWRAETFWDPYGAATGVPNTYHEMTVGLVYKPKPWLWIRPEARVDWVQGTPVFNDSTRRSQLTFAMDVILLF